MSSIAIFNKSPNGVSGPGLGMFLIRGWSKRLVATVRWSTVERMPHFDDTAELLLAAILAR